MTLSIVAVERQHLIRVSLDDRTADSLPALGRYTFRFSKLEFQVIGSLGVYSPLHPQALPRIQ